MFIYYLSEFGRSIFSWLPACICYPCSRVAGDILYRCWSHGRYHMKQNVTAVVPPGTRSTDINKITRRCFHNICKYAMDFARFSGVKNIYKKGTFTLVGQQKIDSALEKGHGAILVGFHVGSWDLGARLLHQNGYKVSSVAGDLYFGSWDNGQINRFFKKWRARIGMCIIMAQEGMNKMLATLHRNELLAILVDCPKCTTGISVQFAGRQVTIPPGAALLALRSHASIIPCCIIRNADSAFTCTFFDHIDYQPTGNLKRDVVELTQHIVSASEKIVKQFADQWFMFQPFVREEIKE